MKLLGKPLIDECKKRHPTLRLKLDALVKYIEAATWKTPVDLKATLGSADPIGRFYAIDVGGKKGARLIILIQFEKETVVVERIFTDHDQYMKWTNKSKTEQDKKRRRGNQ